MQPLGFPVVPDVNAIRATSSFAVSTFVKAVGLASARDSSSPPGPKVSSSLEHGLFPLGLSDRGGAARVRQGVGHLRALDDLGELSSSQERHRRDGDSARLQHAEP